MSSLVNAVEIGFKFDKHTIFDSISFNINRSQIIGVVGRNGTGKTTLLKILAGSLEIDNGKIVRQKEMRVGYLPQEFELKNDKTVYQNILETEIFTNKEITFEEEEMIKSTLKDLYILDYKNSLVKHLSGGQKRRVGLAKALLNQPDLLILDEPTNHLDIKTSEHLEKLIKNFKGSVILVSHDRYFLDKVTNHIFEIYNHNIFVHRGNYSKYLENKALRLEIAKAEDEKRQQWLKREKEWVIAGVRARETKNKGRLENYYKIEAIPEFKNEPKIKKFIPEASFLGSRILNLKNVNIDTPDGKSVLNDFSLDFAPDMKIGLLGENGAGKSTFLKTLIGQLEPKSGTIKIGKNTLFNYLDQEKALLNPAKTIFQEVANEKDFVLFGDKLVNSRGYLKRFLFDPKKLDRFVGELSGGERTRVVLAKNLCQSSNFLVLDEPTNDLDIETLNALELSILEFNGPAIIVSHDRYFLNKVCNYILNLKGNGEFVLSTGNYDTFLNKVNKDTMPIVEEIKAKVEPKKTVINPLLLEMLEKEIQDLNNKIYDFESKFTDPGFYTRNIGKIGDLKKKLDQMQAELEAKETRWLELVG